MNAGPLQGSTVPPVHRLTLRDGRTLAYIEIGDTHGYPVLSNHGGLSSRIDVVPAHASAGAHGLRIISPDRPGVGRSDRDDGRALRDWATDVHELAEHLGLGQFAVMGWSLGGCYALAVTRYLPERVSLLSLVASTIPKEWGPAPREGNRMDRAFATLSRSAVGRVGDRIAFRLMRAGIHTAPRAFARASGLHGVAGAWIAAAVVEGLSDTRGVVHEYQVLDAPWGFDPAEITVPTQIWQGDADRLVPAGWAARLHHAIAGSTLTLVPGGTHFLWYEHWDAIFAAMVKRLPSQEQPERDKGG